MAPPFRLLTSLRAFLHAEAAGGIVLVAAAALAMLAANLPATAAAYQALIYLATGPVLAPKLGPMTIHLWINDGAMALFFLLVGLEIKRELVAGELATWQARRLPFVAAAAGMVVPALVYLSVAGGDPRWRAGWAIPAATDIAFALGVLALLGRRVPSTVKLLLATIAIVDDMGAVAIIAIAYTARIDVAALAGAAAMLTLLFALNRSGTTRLWPYLLAGALLWFFVLRSGVHATVAGVLLASLVPLRGGALQRLEHALHPWSAFVVVPLFAFANAGVALGGLGWASLRAPLVLGVAAGLFLGKQIGILGGIALASRLGIAPRPAGVTWRQLWGMALVAGIGFTMSLFIGGLAFPGDPTAVEQVKLGVLAGSLASALLGAAMLAGARETAR